MNGFSIANIGAIRKWLGIFGAVFAALFVFALVTLRNDPIYGGMRLNAVRQNAVQALGRAGNTSDVPVLKAAIESEPYWLSVDYAEAIWMLDRGQSNYVMKVLRECRAHGSATHLVKLLEIVEGHSGESTSE